jgi:hypothetical protein
LKNKTTYEMSDIMGLITRDLEEKGLAPDSASVEIWGRVDGARISVKEIEIEANVSWVGVPEQGDARAAAPRARNRREPDLEAEPAPQDLLDEAPRPGGGPALEIGIDEVTAASTRIARSGGPGPFSPERVKRRLTEGESTEYPGTTPRER